MRDKIVYTVGCLVLIGLFFLNYFKYQMKEDTLISQDLMQVVITQKDCNSYVQGNSYLLFYVNHKKESVTITPSACGSYNI